MKQMFAAYATQYSIGLAKVTVESETAKTYSLSKAFPKETLVGYVGYVPKRINKVGGTADIRLFESGREATEYLVAYGERRIKALRGEIQNVESAVGPLRKILKREANR